MPTAAPSPTETPAAAAVRDRLLVAARECFLADDYHVVTTRQIARAAGTNVSMIRYYFGGKAGLYEEMIRDTLRPLLAAVDSPMMDTTEGFASLFKLYYDTMIERPQFPKLVLKVLALNQAPGKQVLWELIERGKRRGNIRVEDLKSAGEAAAGTNPDMVRIAFISLAMTPMLLREIFEREMGRPFDPAFLDALAQFHGHLFRIGLTPQQEDRTCRCNETAAPSAPSRGC
jgi:AcrR family transcriptional regulator